MDHNLIKLRPTPKGGKTITPSKALKMINSVFEKNFTLRKGVKKEVNESRRNIKTEKKRRILRDSKMKNTRKKILNSGVSQSVKKLNTYVTRTVSPIQRRYKLKEFPKMSFSFEGKKVTVERSYSMNRKMRKSRRFNTKSFFNPLQFKENLKIQKFMKVAFKDKNNFFSEKQY